MLSYVMHVSENSMCVILICNMKGSNAACLTVIMITVHNAPVCNEKVSIAGHSDIRRLTEAFSVVVVSRWLERLAEGKLRLRLTGGKLKYLENRHQIVRQN